MLEFADRLGAATLATGHYARVERATTQPDRCSRLAADPAKDQTYMLAALSPESLARMRFPLGDYEKRQVRALAAQAGLSVGEQGRLPGPLLPGGDQPWPLPAASRRHRATRW